ncbi:acyltransferase family protein [Roseicella aquatilis]|uniref:Acyltransferase n=1 Tax=Roseicella aquatilis TaxID=2527868 RepID=A0A4V2WM34_9PROT|nr:acyltransferase [Roseicella aquatilis]TCZ66112.1 acyltransferase [Roseicella aquatilis]
MKSVGKVLDGYKGFGPGFDFLRIFLALAIIAWHVATLTGHRDIARSTPFWFAEYSLVPMFFMLSGFLVAGSGMRLDLKNFILNRTVRIVPALAVDIFFAALIIGPLLTTLPITHYFMGRTFYTYFLNILGWPHYLLPGVFETNFSTGVNGSLWTVPYEIGCYVIFSFLIYFNIIRRPHQVAVMTVLLLLTAIVIEMSGLVDAVGPRSGWEKTLDFLFLEKGARLWPSFLIGILFYQFRYLVPFDRRLLAAVLAICISFAILGDFGTFFDSTVFHAFMLPLLGYIMVFLGLSQIPVPKLFRTGDYSYGLYLYHVPFIQALLALFPATWYGGWWWTLYFAAVPVALIVAILSWHVVEKPALRLRKKFSFAVTMREQAESTAPKPHLSATSASAAFSSPAE